ncbi:MAG: hypothetical protein KC535_01795, partial [Nanoarchaeota archaeon]|nr:hypothetical protein [Nanoarchaeota archaeon]
MRLVFLLVSIFLLSSSLASAGNESFSSDLSSLSGILMANLEFWNGSSTIDYTGNGFDGTNSSAIYNATGGPFGNGAYNFNGSQYIILDNSTDLYAPETFSVALWVENPTFESYEKIVAKADDNVDSWGIDANSGGGGSYRFFINDGAWNGNFASFSAPPTNWTHVVGTYNRSEGNIRIYVNGVEGSSAAYDARINHLSHVDAVVGARRDNDKQYPFGSVQNFNGSIASVQIYNYTLNSSQVLDLYHNGTFNYTPYTNNSRCQTCGADYEFPFLSHYNSTYNTSDINKSYPVVIFLHGQGELGSDLSLISSLSYYPSIAAQNTTAIVISPQAESGGFWSYAAYIERLDAFVEQLIDYHDGRIDEDRIYLTGLSMGGMGVWRMAINYGDLFAAYVPISSNTAGDTGTCNIKGKPVWGFHGDADGTVDVTGTTVPISWLNGSTCGEPYPDERIAMTIYPGRGHETYVWGGTYDGSNGYDMWSWMYQFTRIDT